MAKPPTSRIRWGSLRGAPEVLVAVARRLPSGSTEADLRDFARTEGLVCSPTTDGIVRCATQRRSAEEGVEERWLLRFHFDGEELASIDVERGLIAP